MTVQTTAPDETPDSSIQTLIKTPGAFQAWLDGLDDDETVGVTRNPYCCPVAVFLASRYPDLAANATAIVVKTDIQVQDAGSIGIPAWMDWFIDVVDDLARYPKRPTARQVRAALHRALALHAADQEGRLGEALLADTEINAHDL